MHNILKALFTHFPYKIATDQLINLSLNVQYLFQYYISLPIVFIGVILLIILITYTFLFTHLIIITRKNAKLSTELEQYKTKYAYTAQAKQTVSLLKDIKHDNRQYFHTIQGLLVNKEYTALEKYVHSMKPIPVSAINFPSIGIPVIDAILTNKLNVANSFNIKIIHSIQITSSLPINDLDFSIILGNALDNAIESCCKLCNDSLKQINLSMQTYRGTLNIKITNSSDGIYVYDNKRLMTTKKGTDHGIGCRRIIELTEKFHGFCIFDANENTFTTIINIPYL